MVVVLRQMLAMNRLYPERSAAVEVTALPVYASATVMLGSTERGLVARSDRRTL
jgi:hypothetical protein